MSSTYANFCLSMCTPFQRASTDVVRILLSFIHKPAMHIYCRIIRVVFFFVVVFSPPSHTHTHTHTQAYLCHFVRSSVHSSFLHPLCLLLSFSIGVFPCISVYSCEQIRVFLITSCFCWFLSLSLFLLRRVGERLSLSLSLSLSLPSLSGESPLRVV